MSKVIIQKKKSHLFGWRCIFVEYDISREASLRLEPEQAGASEELSLSWGEGRAQRSIEFQENVFDLSVPCSQNSD